MGYRRFTHDAYLAARSKYVPATGPATSTAEQAYRETKKLDPLVDPAEFGLVRESRIRFVERPDGLFVNKVGMPVPVEIRLDTTGSMGSNVDKALKVLPDTYDLLSKVLPDMDPQIATSIFGDRDDRVTLCRSQYEALAKRIVRQLALMVPERAGGDFPEDPQYGLFAGAYLTSAYINRVGLKRYDFTVTDAPGREYVDHRMLIKIFGESVYEKVSENGWQIPKSRPISTKRVIIDLLKQAHAFLLQVNNDDETREFWQDIYGEDRIVTLPKVTLLPEVQASIIGLTEGTLELEKLPKFLKQRVTSNSDIDKIIRSITNIPIGDQTILKNFGKGPKPGDVFRNKTDLWPLDPASVPPLDQKDEAEGDLDWL